MDLLNTILNSPLTLQATETAALSEQDDLGPTATFSAFYTTVPRPDSQADDGNNLPASGNFLPLNEHLDYSATPDVRNGTAFVSDSQASNPTTERLSNTHSLPTLLPAMEALSANGVPVTHREPSGPNLTPEFRGEVAPSSVGQEERAQTGSVADRTPKATFAGRSEPGQDNTPDLPEIRHLRGFPEFTQPSTGNGSTIGRAVPEPLGVLLSAQRQEQTSIEQSRAERSPVRRFEELGVAKGFGENSVVALVNSQSTISEGFRVAQDLVQTLPKPSPEIATNQQIGSLHQTNKRTEANIDPIKLAAPLVNTTESSTHLRAAGLVAHDQFVGTQPSLSAGDPAFTKSVSATSEVSSPVRLSTQATSPAIGHNIILKRSEISHGEAREARPLISLAPSTAAVSAQSAPKDPVSRSFSSERELPARGLGAEGLARPALAANSDVLVRQTRSDSSELQKAASAEPLRASFDRWIGQLRPQMTQTLALGAAVEPELVAKNQHSLAASSSAVFGLASRSLKTENSLNPTSTEYSPASNTAADQRTLAVGASTTQGVLVPAQARTPGPSASSNTIASSNSLSPVFDRPLASDAGVESSANPTSTSSPFPPTAKAALAPGVGSPLSSQPALTLDDPDFSLQFSKQAILAAKNGLQKAEIRLSPANLGTIRVEIEMNERGTNVQFQVSSIAAKEAVEVSLPKLREMFDASGLKLIDSQVGQQQDRSGGSRTAHSSQRMDEGVERDAQQSVADDTNGRRAVSRNPQSQIDTFV